MHLIRIIPHVHFAPQIVYKGRGYIRRKFPDCCKKNSTAGHILLYAATFNACAKYSKMSSYVYDHNPYNVVAYYARMHFLQIYMTSQSRLFIINFPFDKTNVRYGSKRITRTAMLEADYSGMIITCPWYVSYLYIPRFEVLYSRIYSLVDAFN